MAIDGLKKHFGFLNNTGTRIIVIFRALPADPSSALVVSLDSLPDSWRDEVINAANSQAGQATVDFYTALQNRTFSDGSNALTGLHVRGYLKKVPVSNVTMTPLTGQKVPLELINASIDKTVPEYMAKQQVDEKVVEPSTEVVEPVVDKKAIAQGLLLQAELMESEAARKKEEAYNMFPELRPSRGRPSLSDDQKAKVLEERKEKRRLRDQKKAAEAKAAKKESVLEDKIRRKIQRDAVRQDPVDLSQS